jgi:hypothetical protein
VTDTSGLRLAIFGLGLISSLTMKWSDRTAQRP